MKRLKVCWIGFGLGLGLLLGPATPMSFGAALITEDFVYLPKEFEVPDFKFRQDQEVQIKAILRQDAVNRGESFDESIPPHVALNRALDRGPSPLIALLTSKDEYLLEVALDGLAIRFGPNAASAAPQIFKVWDNPANDNRTRQLAVRCLQVIAPRDLRVLTEVLKRAKSTPTTDYPLRCALVDFFGAHGERAVDSVPWITGELASVSGRVAYQSLHALSKIVPPPSSDPAAWLEPGALESLSAASWVTVENHLARKAPRSDEILKELLKASGEEALKYRRVIAIKSVAALNATDEQALAVLLQGISDEDEFLQRVAVDAIQSMPQPPEALVPSLVQLLDQGNSSLKIRVANLLTRFGPAAAPASAALARQLKAATDRTPESEIGAYLLTLRAIGPAAAPVADTLAELLPEQALILKNRSKLRIHHIRGYILVTLADIGVPKKAMPYVIDGLANSPRNMPYAFASAARAAASLGPQAKVCVPYLLRALQGELDDDYLSFDSLNVHKSSNGEYTTGRLEAIKALGAIGSTAREAIPLLQELVNQPALDLSVSGRLYRVPSLVEEARKALKAIQS